MSFKNINILDLEELEYIQNSEYVRDYPGLIDALNVPQFTIKDLGVTARDATYWDKKNILPQLKGKNTTRRKYTLKQAIWIKLIQQLRSFDISLNQIRKVKENLLKDEINFKELVQTEAIQHIFEQLAQNQGQLEEYKKLITGPEFNEELDKISLDMFEINILYAIIFRKDLSYIVTVDGLCLPYVFDKHEIMKESNEGFESVMKSPHIVLSITQAYSQLIQDWSEKKWFNNVSIVSKDEKKILALLRDRSTKELKIMKKGSELDRVIQIRSNPIDAIEEFANHIVRNGYQTMTISTRQGKPVHFRNEVSIKLKNIPE